MQIKSLLIFNTILFLSLFSINSTVYATDWNKAQTSKSGIVDMMEVLPEYLQVNSTTENRDFHIKRNERSIGTGAQYYFYFEGGTLTVSMTTDGVFRIGSTILGSSTTGNASYPINLASGTETTGIMPVIQGGTGSNTAAGARSSLGAAKSGDNTDITSADNLRLKVGTSTYGKPVYVLFNDTNQYSLTGTTTETTVWTYTLKANTLNANGVLRLELNYNASPGGSNLNQYGRVYFGETLWKYRNIGAGGGTATTYDRAEIFNKGSTSVQTFVINTAIFPWQLNLAPMASSTVNTAQDVTLSVTLQSSFSTGTASLVTIKGRVENP